MPPYETTVDDVTGLAILDQFVSLVRSIVSLRSDVALASEANLGGIVITDSNLSIAALAAKSGGRAKEQWRYVQQRRNIAPFSSAPDLNLPGLHEECLHREVVAIGLAVALASRQLAVSFAFDEQWSVAELELVVRQMVESPDDELRIVDAVERIPHASHHDHVRLHSEVIANLSLPYPYSGLDLWADRVHRYPGLDFLEQVGDQLVGFGRDWRLLSAIDSRLLELSETCAEWRRSGATGPLVWRSKVTPESDRRKPLCIFVDSDGVQRCFDMHARYTPTAGRIHFVVDREIGKLRVAYIGTKLV